MKNNKIETFRTLKVATDDDLLNLENELGNRYIYRGQFDSEWELKTSLTRFIEKAGREFRFTPRSFENEFVYKFKQRIKAYEITLNNNEDIVEILSYIQHYGGPTRLLDFSKSFFVALYFAISENGEKDSSLWCVKKRSLIENNIEFKNNYYNGIISDDVYLIEPSIYNKRLLAQQGCFISTLNEKETIQNIYESRLDLAKGVPIPHKKTNNVLYDTRPSFDDTLIKIIIDKSLHTDIEIRLFRSNINSETLYRDQAGMIKSLKFHYQHRLEPFSDNTRTLANYYPNKTDPTEQK